MPCSAQLLAETEKRRGALDESVEHLQQREPIQITVERLGHSPSSRAHIAEDIFNAHLRYITSDAVAVALRAAGYNSSGNKDTRFKRWLCL